MIQLCPYCGHVLLHPLQDGITSCLNCSRVFDSCPFNRLLSAGWLARKQNITDVDILASYGFTMEESILVIAFVIEKEFNHEDFMKALKNLTISQQYVPQPS